MRIATKAKAGLGVTAAIVVIVGLAAPPAGADYAPSKNDVVGVGSDTVQYAIDFMADGDFLQDAGYNSAGNKNKLANFDATPDANARLAYGAQGLGPSCAPGTGGTVGTGNQNANHTEPAATPACVLNPTIVLRAGLQPVTRMNGSGNGRTALLADTVAPFKIDFARSSSAYGLAITQPGGPTSAAVYDSVKLGTDGLAMLSKSAPTTNAVALSASQLKYIYSCSGTGTGGTTFWDDPVIGGTSHTVIKPLLPQVGSGTRSSFLAAINGGTALTPGTTCGIANVEENDPEAIDASGAAADAIEPMSSGRLNMFLGKLGDGTANGVGGYFKDPSCLFSTTAAPCPQTLTPDVKYWTTGTPVGSPAPGALFNINRDLFVYFRHSDLASTKKFQSGSTLNWVRTLFYNPCTTGVGCVTDPITGDVYASTGAPYIATAAGQALISAAGITPAYVAASPGA